MSRLGNVGGRLYRGEVSVEFVRRQRLWYTISGLILVTAVAALLINGLNYSVEFKGGSVFQFKASNVSTAQIASTVQAAGGGNDPIVQQVGISGKSKWQVQTSKLSYAQQTKVQNAIASKLHVTGGASQVSTTFVGPSWGSQISKKALEALIAFLIVIVIYLSIAFEWKMAVAAFVALVHDIVITVGVYALAGFQVSPATVIGLLTILGYSLYDTVVVFDKVRENTAGLIGTSRSTYSQAANLALNQTLVRSINTSLTALLPVGAILAVAVAVLGTGELQDLALVLFIGMLSGTYSSICIATPVLADLKEREPQYKQLAKRVALRASGGRAAQRARARAEKAEKAGVAARGQARGAGSGAAFGGSGEPAAAETAGDSSLEPAADPDGTRAGDVSASGAPAGDVSASGAPAGDVSASGAPAGDVSAGDGSAEEAGAPGAPDERVPAGRAAAGPARGSPAARSGPRQQPRRTSSAARRRPAGKKKRR